MFGLTALDRKLRAGWASDQSSGWAWGSRVLPHERPRSLLPTAMPGAQQEPKDEPKGPMTLTRAIEANSEKLCVHFWPGGRESGLGWEVRPGLNIKLGGTLAGYWSDTQRGGSGDFLAVLIHAGGASSRAEAKRLVEEFLGVGTLTEPDTNPHYFS